jgi:hypothetical protein
MEEKDSNNEHRADGIAPSSKPRLKRRSAGSGRNCITRSLHVIVVQFAKRNQIPSLDQMIKEPKIVENGGGPGMRPRKRQGRMRRS